MPVAPSYKGEGQCHIFARAIVYHAITEITENTETAFARDAMGFGAAARSTTNKDDGFFSKFEIPSIRLMLLLTHSSNPNGQPWMGLC